MATFQPSYGEFGKAACSDNAPKTGSRLESFFWKLLMLTALTYFVWSDAISIGIGPVSIEKNAVQGQGIQRKTDFFGLLGFSQAASRGIQLEESPMDNLAVVIDPGYADRYGIPKEQVSAHLDRCSLFIKRFSPVAIAEMRRYGVPASILLAQALMASNAGDDPISRETNNFFRRPCRPGNCNATHFSDMATDLDQVAEVDVYPNLWGSFRAQSLFFSETAPFAGLFTVQGCDYKSWAEGLDKGGYSPDPQYGAKLVAIIEGLDLAAFDGR